MKYFPVFKRYSIDPINTPNKYINSYFMKNDKSCFTPDHLKYPNYGCSASTVFILIENSFVLLNGKKYDMDFFVDYSFNLQAYSSSHHALASFYTFLKPLVATESCQVSLIISDFFGRFEIVSFIDLIFNYLNFKSVLILPISLSLSFYLNLNFCCFVYDNRFSFIDDFSQVESKNAKMDVQYADNEDFAEEFCRSFIEERRRYNCLECAHKEDSLERIQSHIRKEHTTGEFFFYEEDKDESVEKKAKYLFTREKYSKIYSNVYYIGKEGENTISRDSYCLKATEGAGIFINLDAAKELWMTDHEWRNTRIRILKEKLLFYI